MAEFITPLQLAAQYGHSYVCKYLYDNMYCVWSISLQMTPIPLAITMRKFLLNWCNLVSISRKSMFKYLGW